MSKLIRLVSLLCTLIPTVAALAGVPSGQAKPPAEPAKIQITVSPQSVPAGGTAEVTIGLDPKSGIRINRYPKIKLVVPEQRGLSGEVEASIGNDRPPPAGQTEANYYTKVDPLTLRIKLDKGATPGAHEFNGNLVYYYCVKKSGFCAPARVKVKIPVEVR